MAINDPQFIYVILILPGLFGLTLIGEGLHKITNQEWSGLIGVVLGGVFLAIVGFAYLFFSSFMK